jgi:hypothetical protein
LPQQDPCAIEALGLLDIGSAWPFHRYLTVWSDIPRLRETVPLQGSCTSNARLTTSLIDMRFVAAYARTP